MDIGLTSRVDAWVILALSMVARVTGKVWKNVVAKWGEIIDIVD